MNTASTRHTAAALATATAVAAALTTMSVIAPTAATAERADPFSGTTTHRAGTVDIGLHVAHRKALMAQYYVDNALELHQRAAR